MPGKVYETQNPRSDEVESLEIPGFFRGVDNRSPETAIPDGAAREIVNADVYKDGNVQSRVGYSLVTSATLAHSLWTTPEIDFALFVDNGSIKKLDQYGNITNLSITVSKSNRMSYVWYNDIIYYSNGVESGRIINNTGYTWGLPVPSAPVLSATNGSMYAGEYCVTLVNVTSAGEESGAPMAATITLTDNQGISVPTASVTGITYVDVYVTDTNGDMFYRAGRVDAGSTFIVDRGPRGKLLKTQFGRAPYAGTIVQGFNGRLYIANGTTIWYTDPLSPNMIFPRTNFLLFERPITMIAPMVDGLYIGTDKRCYWLNGDDPTRFRQNLTQPHGVIRGTPIPIPGYWFITEQVWPSQGNAWAWRDTEGVLCIGRPEGFVQRINDNLIKLSNYEEGSSTIVRRDGLQQVLSSFWNAGDNAVTFGDSVTAEVISNNLS